MVATPPATPGGNEVDSEANMERIYSAHHARMASDFTHDPLQQIVCA